MAAPRQIKKGARDLVSLVARGRQRALRGAGVPWFRCAEYPSCDRGA